MREKVSDGSWVEDEGAGEGCGGEGDRGGGESEGEGVDGDV